MGSRWAAASVGVIAVMVYPGSNALAAGDKALGEYLSSECVTCHQLSGREQPGIPTIVGISEAQIRTALLEYKDKKRSNAVMQTVAGKFSQDEIAALAAYFGSLKPSR
jgi:cytochrome c553